MSVKIALFKNLNAVILLIFLLEVTRLRYSFHEHSKPQYFMLLTCGG